MKESRANELRAGAFVLVGILVFTAAIFLLGKKSALFTRNTELFAHFQDISGLVVGAPVRLAGLEVGTVGAISFSEDPHDRAARVSLVIQSRFMERIRADSEAFIDSAGLLGDKVVNISMGSPQAGSLQDGATLKTRRTATFEALSTTLGEVVQSLANIANKVEGMVSDGRTEQVQRDVSRIAASVANIMHEVEQGDGLLHRLVYDRRMAAESEALVADARLAVQKAERVLSGLEDVVAEVQSGRGSAHELIYGESGKQMLSSLNQTAQQLNELLTSVRDGDGVLHTLVYEHDQGNFLHELNEMSVALNRIVQDMDKGRGTVGALLKDPTVYEDLKTVLGNVKRNVLLKALVRFTMEKDQLRRAEEAPAVSSP